MSTPREGSGGDSTVWGLENDGRFSVKSAYCLIKDFDPVAGSSIWNKVWRWEGPTLLIGWRLGDEGWYTLNTDGSLIPTTSSAAAGGVIRDDQGRFVLAFSSNLGSCSIVRAEIWAILEGMVLAWDKGIRKLRIQTDSVSAVQLLTDMRGLLHKHSNLVNLFQDYKSRPWEVSIEHIFREANNAADFLANSGHQLDLGTTVFDLPCPTLLNWLRYDLISVCLPRRVNNIS
ncbi:Putative ribonuclease H protein At1g65750 [Linum perenne]